MVKTFLLFPRIAFSLGLVHKHLGDFTEHISKTIKHIKRENKTFQTKLNISNQQNISNNKTVQTKKISNQQKDIFSET